jgi:hypothetical protein
MARTIQHRQVPDPVQILIHEARGGGTRGIEAVKCRQIGEGDGQASDAGAEPALKQLIDDYRGFARSHSRAKPWITVIGDDNLPRPRGLDWDSLVLDAGFRDDLGTQARTLTYQALLHPEK